MRTRRLALVIWLAVLVVLEAGATDRVRDTRFNRDRGFYDAPFTVVIQSRTAGARIRFTIDGSEPTPTHGLGGENPVVVAVETTTTLRAVAYKDGLLPSDVDTHTYVFPRHVVRQPRHIDGLPSWVGEQVMGSVTELDYEMDPAIVNHPDYRDAIVPSLKSIPTISLVMDPQALFGQVFRADGLMERAESGVYFGYRSQETSGRVSVELIDPRRRDRAFQVDARLESHAAAGVKRALKLSFQKEYGAARLKSEFLRDAPLNGDSATTRFDRLVLRSGHTRSFAGVDAAETTYLRDQWVRDSQIAMSGLGAHGTFVHLYLNGLYWGLYNVVERPDAWFTSAYLGGEKEDWLGVNHNGVLHGDARRWAYLRGELKDRDLSKPEPYREISGYLDLDHFADYVLLGWYSRLDDWGPGRNWYGGNRNEPPGPFRFFMWDAEYSLFASATPMAWVHRAFRRDQARLGPDMVGLWHALARNPDFLMRFADRVYDHCFHGALTEARSKARLERLAAFVDLAIVAESARWGDAREALGEPTRTRNETFRPEVERLLTMMTGNVAHFIAELRREGYYPTLDPPTLDDAADGIAFVHDDEDVPIFYTLDGSDPRSSGGGVEPGALEARPGERVTAPTLRARARRDGEWSPLVRRDPP